MATLEDGFNWPTTNTVLLLEWKPVVLRQPWPRESGLFRSTGPGEAETEGPTQGQWAGGPRLGKLGKLSSPGWGCVSGFVTPTPTPAARSAWGEGWAPSLARRPVLPGGEGA